MTISYRAHFEALFRAVAACEAPAGTQVDDVLEEFQSTFEEAAAEIETSAEFGECYGVVVQYNTDPSGFEIPDDAEGYPETLHGTFDTEAEAVEWMNARPDDTDTHDMFVVPINRVRPA